MNSKRRGSTIIELLVASMVLCMIGSSVCGLVIATYNSTRQIMDENNAAAYARTATDTIVDTTRSTAGLTRATASDITFTNGSGQAVRYWLNNGKLVTSVAGVPAAGTTVAPSISSLAITYYTYSGGTWTGSTAPASPAGVGTLYVTTTATLSGRARTVASWVRLREK